MLVVVALPVLGGAQLPVGIENRGDAKLSTGAGGKSVGRE